MFTMSTVTTTHDDFSEFVNTGINMTSMNGFALHVIDSSKVPEITGCYNDDPDAAEKLYRSIGATDNKIAIVFKGIDPKDEVLSLFYSSLNRDHTIYILHYWED